MSSVSDGDTTKPEALEEDCEMIAAFKVGGDPASPMYRIATRLEERSRELRELRGKATKAVDLCEAKRAYFEQHKDWTIMRDYREGAADFAYDILEILETKP